MKRLGRHLVLVAVAAAGAATIATLATAGASETIRHAATTAAVLTASLLAAAFHRGKRTL
jgi:hypothetical protein